jgi:TonB family protein
MPVNPDPVKYNFGLLPEPEGRSESFITSTVINGLILILALVVGMIAKPKLEAHTIEQTMLVVPNTPPPPEKPKIKVEAPKLPNPPKMPEVKLDTPKIQMPKIEPKPEPKPVQLEAKVNLPVIKAKQQTVIAPPQPKAALAAAAAPAQTPQAHPSTAPVHLGQTFGVTPNPNATRPATVAAIGNPYGGMKGPAVAPRGVVGSTGLGNGTRSGSSTGVVGKVASAGIPGNVAASSGNSGKVASTGLAKTVTAVATPKVVAAVAATEVELLSKPTSQYTAEARQLRVQGDVILRVTFTASGQVQVQGVVRGLGHGLDEEARRVAQQIRFRPATRNGQPVDRTTNITITFQLA